MIIITDFECPSCESDEWYLENKDTEVLCALCDEYCGSLDNWDYYSKEIGQSSSNQSINTSIKNLMNNNKSPYEKQEEEMNSTTIVSKILNLDTYQRKHQTLVIVYTKSYPNQTHMERATRLVSSLNTNDTIKADIMSASDGNLYEGIVWTGTNPGGVDINEIGKRCGFNQVIEVTYIGAGEN